MYEVANERSYASIREIYRRLTYRRLQFPTSAVPTVGSEKKSTSSSTYFSSDRSDSVRAQPRMERTLELH